MSQIMSVQENFCVKVLLFHSLDHVNNYSVSSLSMLFVQSTIQSLRIICLEFEITVSCF